MRGWWIDQTRGAGADVLWLVGKKKKLSRVVIGAAGNPLPRVLRRTGSSTPCQSSVGRSAQVVESSVPRCLHKEQKGSRPFFFLGSLELGLKRSLESNAASPRHGI
jgi:hypothetical protein